MDSVIDGIDYGPLAGLLGRWSGSRGMDVSPDNQAQDDKTAFNDEITFRVAGVAENAEEQQLVGIRYRHVVRKSSSGLIFHDQIGHWLYEPKTRTIMHSLTIPRGVCILAGGKLTTEGRALVFDVSATAGDDTFGVLQSPFMKDKARTKAFTMKLVLEDDALSYQETTSLHIYGADFEHVDASKLQRITYDPD